MIDPVSMTVVVPLPKERAFQLFTSEIGSWWPLATHSIGQESAVSCGMEPRVGGALYESLSDGERHSWGRVVVWEPHDRVAFSWHPGHEESEAQQVEVRFTPDGSGTRVDLRHYGWEALAEKAQAVRDGYANGWKHVFGELFVEAARKAAAAEVLS